MMFFYVLYKVNHYLLQVFSQDNFVHLLDFNNKPYTDYSQTSISKANLVYKDSPTVRQFR